MNTFFTAYSRFQAQNVKNKKYLVKLSDIDRDIKMGRNSGDIALQMFIMKKDM